jgi:hypothetical protein
VDNEGQGDGDIDIIDIQLVASWWNRPLPSAGLARSTAAPPSAARLTVRRANGEAGPCWEVIAEGAVDLAGFQFDIVSSEAVQSSAFELGEFLRAGGNVVTLLGPQATGDGRRVTVGGFSYGSSSGATGSGTLLRIRAEHGGPLRLENVLLADMQGRAIPVSGVAQETANVPVPRTLSLHQNYPNPFNPETSIRFEVPGEQGKAVHVTLRVVNLKGEAVRTLVDEERVPGAYMVSWDGRDNDGRPLPSGVYLCTLNAGQQRVTAKMTLMR